jgi:hypothetical protein
MLGLTGKVIRTTCVVAIICGVISAVYLTDRRSCDLQTIPWLPWWLRDVAHWADYHGRFRNVPAYGMLSVPVLVLFTTTRNRGRAVVYLAMFATIMEYTQLFIPTRYFDWYDIAESWIGIVAVWALVELAYFLARFMHRATAPKGCAVHPHTQERIQPRQRISLPRLAE